MNPAANPEITDPSADWARSLYEQQIAMLGELAETGMELVRGIKARAAEPEADAQRAFIDFTRVARAVRLTLLLQARMIKDLESRDRQGAGKASFERKAQVRRIVGRIAARQTDDPDEIERLDDAVYERIDSEDLYGPLLDRPVSELVALICRDLGLDPDWPRLSEEAWALKEAGDTSRFPTHEGWAVAHGSRTLPLDGEGQGWGVSTGLDAGDHEAVSPLHRLKHPTSIACDLTPIPGPS